MTVSNMICGKMKWALSPPISDSMVTGKPRYTPALSRLRIEKIEGGLVVAGCVVANNCQIILPIFGFLFMLIGCVLTAASYRGCGADEQPHDYKARMEFTGNSRVLGPFCIVTGVIMTLAGVGLCLLTRAAQRRQKRLAFHCPIHGDFYPVNPYTSKSKSERKFLVAGLRCCRRESECAMSTARCPRSSSPEPGEPSCPPPLPFVVPSDSVVGSVLGAPLTPEQTFGSIRSLVTSREVASFPMSRTPSPPVPREIMINSDAMSAIDIEDQSGSSVDTIKVVECKMSRTDSPQMPSFTPKSERSYSVTLPEG